jgi:ABC-2 type transport system permease protein
VGHEVFVRGRDVVFTLERRRGSTAWRLRGAAGVALRELGDDSFDLRSYYRERVEAQSARAARRVDVAAAGGRGRMSALLRMEIGKLGRFASVRFSASCWCCSRLWAYAPGIFDVYGFFLVSGFQVPALALLSSMEFLLPLLIAITCAELIGIEINHGTLPTVLLRPVTRAQWLLAKLLVASAYPFLALGFFLLASLVAGAAFFGYGPFVGGTGLGRQGLLGAGTMLPPDAWREVLQAYAIAAYSLMPIGLLAVLFAVVLMNAAGGAFATLATLIVMQLLMVFPAVTPYLLTTQLSAYVEPASPLGWVVTLIALYCAAFAAAAVIVFERKDF